MPEQQRGDDSGDQGEDEVGLAHVRAREPPRSLHLADPERCCDTDEDERREHVDEERVPPLALEPAERGARGKRLVTLEDRRDRHEDRREEDEESPEDEGVHDAWPEPLEELPLSENDDRLVAHAGRNVRQPVGGLPRADEPVEEEGTAREQPARDPHRRDERERGGDARRRAQEPPAFRSSAEIAGTTSCRSPITA